MDSKCGKCGSNKIIPVASVQDQGQFSDQKLKAFVYTNPDAWVFKGSVYATLKARICGDCGYAELFAENATDLYRAYLDARP